jgi:hypothetical protein
MTIRREEDTVLTLAYCRVSTEEQAAEGFSIEGQADKLRTYSDLRDLGDATVISDPGLSGKDMKRPGLQQLLAADEAGHVSHVLVWRLDRLSRNLGNLILLADLPVLDGESCVLKRSDSPPSSRGRPLYREAVAWRYGGFVSIEGTCVACYRAVSFHDPVRTPFGPSTSVSRIASFVGSTVLFSQK